MNHRSLVRTAASINPASLLFEDHLSRTQRTDIAQLQEQFADVFSLLLGCTIFIVHQIETSGHYGAVTNLQVT